MVFPGKINKITIFRFVEPVDTSERNLYSQWRLRVHRLEMDE